MSVTKEHYHNTIEAGMRKQPAEHPILFSTDMVKAILEGRKTQTRRTVKPQPADIDEMGLGISGDKAAIQCNELQKVIKCPYGKKGDLLWVRETFTILEPEHCMGGMDSRFVFKANTDMDSDEARKEYIERGYPYQWRPSIHMPKAAARIWLQVEDITVERVQNISGEDAIAEGIKPTPHLSKLPMQYKAIVDFGKLWRTINGKESWNANPFVWVVKFKVLSTVGRPS